MDVCAPIPPATTYCRAKTGQGQGQGQVPTGPGKATGDLSLLPPVMKLVGEQDFPSEVGWEVKENVSIVKRISQDFQATREGPNSLRRRRTVPMQPAR